MNTPSPLSSSSKWSGRGRQNNKKIIPYIQICNFDKCYERDIRDSVRILERNFDLVRKVMDILYSQRNWYLCWNQKIRTSIRGGGGIIFSEEMEDWEVARTERRVGSVARAVKCSQWYSTEEPLNCGKRKWRINKGLEICLAGEGGEVDVIGLVGVTFLISRTYSSLHVGKSASSIG